MTDDLWYEAVDAATHGDTEWVHSLWEQAQSELNRHHEDFKKIRLLIVDSTPQTMAEPLYKALRNVVG